MQWISFTLALCVIVAAVATAAKAEASHALDQLAAEYDDYEWISDDDGEASDIEKASRKLVHPPKTFTLRTRSPSLWYRPSGWKPIDSSVDLSSGTIVVATDESSPSARKNIGLLSALKARQPNASTDLPQTTTDVTQHEPWLMEAIEEVVQTGLLPISRSAISDNSVGMAKADFDESTTTVDVASIITTTPTPVSISSAPIWVFASRTPTTIKPTTTGLGGIAVGSSQPQSTVTSIVTSTVKSIPSTLVTTNFVNHNKLVERSTPDHQSRDDSLEPTTTTEWWKAKPNYQFDSLSVKDSLAVDYADGPQPEKQPEIGNGQKELQPPSGNPAFNQQPPAVNRPIIVQQWYQPPPTQQSTPRRPVIVKAPPRTTTTTSTTTARPTTTNTPPKLASTRKPPQEPVDPFLSVTTDDVSITTSAPDEEQLQQKQLNVVVVNLWNYVNGQLSLVGQQVMPSQALSNLDTTNGASSSSSVDLPASVIAALAGLTQSTSTTEATTTPIPLPSRPYGGVGNPSLQGIIQTLSQAASKNLSSPSPSYGVPKPPSSTYGVPSQTYVNPPSQSYGTPPTKVSVIAAPQSVVYGALPPKPTMNQFASEQNPSAGGTAASPNRVTSSTSPGLFFVDSQNPANHKPPQHFVSADSFLSATNAKPTKQVATKRPSAAVIRPVKPDKVIKNPIKGSNLNIISEKPNPAAPGAFVQGGNPIGALLPDFILESLAHAQNGKPSVPLGTLPRTPGEAGEAFASRLGGSSVESDATAGLDVKTVEHDDIPQEEEEEEPSETQPSHYTSQSIGRNKNVAGTQEQPDKSSMADISGVVFSGHDNPVIAARHPLGSSIVANRLSAMEMAYINANDGRKSFYPLDLSAGNQHYYLQQPAAAVPADIPAFKSNADETTTAGPTTTSTTRKAVVPTKADRRFGFPSLGSLPSIGSLPSFRMPSSMMALAAVFPAAALSMPMLVGRKKREEPRREASRDALPLGLMNNNDEDAFVKHFTTENERELRQKDIAAASCRQMIYDQRSGATPEEPTTKTHVDQLKLLICPSDREPTVWNMILLDGKTV